jgi:hypothetical protein
VRWSDRAASVTITIESRSSQASKRTITFTAREPWDVVGLSIRSSYQATGDDIAVGQPVPHYCQYGALLKVGKVPFTPRRTNATFKLPGDRNSVRIMVPGKFCSGAKIVT